MPLLLSSPLFSLVDCCCFIFSNFSLLSGHCAIANVAATTFAVAVTPLLLTTLRFCQHYFCCCILLLSPLSLPPVDCCFLKFLCCGCCGFSKFAIADAVVSSCLCCCTAFAITAFVAPFTPILTTPLQLPLAVIKAIIIIVCHQLIVASLSDLFLIHYRGCCTLPLVQLLLVFAACCWLNHGPFPWQLTHDVFTAG